MTGPRRRGRPRRRSASPSLRPGRPPRAARVRRRRSTRWSIDCRRPLGDLKSKRPRPRLAASAMCCGWRMSNPSVPSGSRPILPAAATGGRSFSFRLASMIRHSTWSIATGSVAKKSALYSQIHSGFPPPGPPWKTPLIPSMICRTHFWRMIGWLTTSGMNWLHTFVAGRAVRPRHVVDRAVAHVLQGARDAGRAVVLQHREHHELVDPPGDQQPQVRAPGPVVLRVLAVGDQLHRRRTRRGRSRRRVEVAGLEVSRP